MKRTLKNTLLGWNTLALIAVTSAASIACDSDEVEDQAEAESTASLNVKLSNLEPLGGGYVYEGWLLNEAGPVSAGRFNLEEGESEISVEIAAAALDGATSYVLTIEPPDDEDVPEPSSTHILAGSWDGKSSELTIADSKALGDDFSTATGQFILGVPTASADQEVAYSQGIWFLDPENSAPSLNLPELPDGWVYEGWVAGEDGPISTGRFVDPAGVDDDGGGPAAGPNDAPPFPGQDFVDPAIDLLASQQVAVISIEPEPDDSTAPFAFKPLIGELTDAGAEVLQDLDLTDKVPSGSVSLAE